MAMLSVLVAFAAATAARPAEPCRPDSSAVREVRAVATGIVAADNARDLERVLGYYAADAVLMPPNGAVVLGRDAIRPRYEALFADYVPEIFVRIDEACVGDGLAFVRGHNGGRLLDPAAKGSRELDDDFLMLLRLDPAGAWRISHLIWHRASAPPAEPRSEPFGQP